MNAGVAACQHHLPVGFQPREEVGVVDQAVFRDFRITGPHFAG